MPGVFRKSVVVFRFADTSALIAPSVRSIPPHRFSLAAVHVATPRRIHPDVFHDTSFVRNDDTAFYEQVNFVFEFLLARTVAYGF